MIEQLLTEKQKNKLDIWKKECYIEGIRIQKEKFDFPDSAFTSCWEIGYPYTGAIGGQFTYIITPTSLGTIIIVKDSITEKEINLTEYENW